MSLKKNKLFIIFTFILCIQFAILSETKAFWQRGPKALIIIDGIKYTRDDYIHWWHEWREPGATIKDDPEDFIEWMLLFREAERMQLFKNPAYQRKVNVFLKVRSLLLLKQEEVDQHINPPSSEDLWDFYQSEYAPVLKMKLVQAKTREEALKIKEKADTGISIEEAAEISGLNDIKNRLMMIGPIRPLNIPEPIRKSVYDLPAQQTGGPVLWQDSWCVYEIIENKEGTEEDFESLRKELIRKKVRSEENRLTQALIERLKKKYALNVNEKVLAAIGSEGVNPEKEKEIVISFKGGNVTADMLFKAIRKESHLRSGNRRGGMDFEKIRDRVVADMIAQTLTSREALERHYERKMPFKHTFEFYSQRRMIKEFEKVVIESNTQISTDEVSQFYDKNKERYARIGSVDMALVKTQEKELADSLAVRLKTGEDFFSVMQVLAPAGIQVKRISFDKLSASQWDVVSKLEPGQVSGSFQDKNDICFVKLIRREEKTYIPLKEVTEQIREELKRMKFTETRKEIIHKLKERSEIQTDSNEWGKLRDQLLSEEHAATNK
ncbi:MAG: peptidyl-prolyl cis-trans isomerase [Desulfobacterales bacterium]|nr:peptidyl-prolyl cis-trans isomerase [Desulfobacterales bacterium]